MEIPQIFPPPSAVGILAPCLFPIRCTARCLPIPVHGLDLPPLLPRFAAKSHLFAAKYVSIWRQIAPVHTRRLRRSRTTSPQFTHCTSAVPARRFRRPCGRIFTCGEMEIATSPFIYRCVTISLPEKPGNLQVVFSLALLTSAHTRRRGTDPSCHLVPPHMLEVRSKGPVPSCSFPLCSFFS